MPQEHFSLATSVSKAFLAQALGVVFDRAYYFDHQQRRETDGRCHAYVSEHLRDLDAFYTESNLGRKAYFSPDQILIGGIQPNLILACCWARNSFRQRLAMRTSRRIAGPASR